MKSTTTAATYATFITLACFLWFGKIHAASKRLKRSNTDNFRRSYDDDNSCDLSNEANKIKLTFLLKKMKEAYYENNRHMVPTNVDFTDKQIKQYYQPYIPSAENLKKNADNSKKILEKLQKLSVNFTLLKPREERVIYQFRYFLESNFDNIFGNYYDGVWMLGPDYFCEQPICFVGYQIYSALKRISVKTLKDLELIIFWISEHRKTFEKYLSNVKLGVKEGMVNPYEVCKASAKTFAKKYGKVYYKGAKGAFLMSFAKLLNDTKYYSKVDKAVFAEYKNKAGKGFTEKLNEVILIDFGEPLKTLIDYLKKEHYKYCPPSNASSGLGGLPLDYQFKNGKRQTSLKTSKKLPSGESIDVDSGYKKFMRYYTTSNITASEAMHLGYKLVAKYYEQVLNLGKELTNEVEEKEMIKKFKKIIKSNKQFYNAKPFPKNESDDDAHDRCDNDEDAAKFCPHRWAVLQKWFENNRQIMKKARPAVDHLFHTKGPMKTTPNCLVKLVPEYNPTNGVPSYLESDPQCSEPASYFLPFFKDDMGPKYEDYNTNFHEARPGHHLQIQGFLENFADKCGGITSWINEVVDYYPSFSEGWGLYAENPILLNDTKVLKESDYLEKYGVLKWQIWRALRIIVDVGFHEKNMTRNQAFDLFSKYTWDHSDTTLKELTRYQGTPGQATSYTSGQQSILSLRKRAQSELGDKFDIKDFHYHLLSQGQAPFYFTSKYIDQYIECTKDKDNERFCDIILNQNIDAMKKDSVYENTELDNQVASLFRLFKKRKHA